MGPTSTLAPGAPGIILIVGDRIVAVKDAINRWFPYEPVFLIGGTALLVHGIHKAMQRVPKDGKALSVEW
jgi:hypothetical protein